MEMPIQQHEIDSTSNSAEAPSTSQFDSTESEKHGRADFKGMDKTAAGKKRLAKSKSPLKEKESKPAEKKICKPTKGLKSTSPVDSMEPEKLGRADIKGMDKTAAGKKSLAKTIRPVKEKESKPAKISKLTKGMKSKSQVDSMESEKLGRADIKGMDKTAAGKKRLAKSKSPVKGNKSKPAKKMAKPTKGMKSKPAKKKVSKPTKGKKSKPVKKAAKSIDKKDKPAKRLRK